MITQITSNPSNRHPFKWIDLVDPSAGEIAQISEEFGIHRISLNDCLEPYHLPKYEQHEDYVFIILRAVDPDRHPDVTDVNQLTRKVAVFLGKNFLLTIHRKDLPFMKSLREKWGKRLSAYSGDPRLHLCLDILNTGFNTFDPPIDAALTLLSTFEQEDTAHLGKVYLLRKQASTYKRLLRLSHDICVKLNADSDQKSRIYVQDLREDLENSLFFAEDLNESIHHFLNLQLSLQAQKTNETMRVMAIFSAFFMPITFLAGVYGMNFKYMPELEWTHGYSFSILLMILCSAIIFIWFKRKKWL